MQIYSSEIPCDGHHHPPQAAAGDDQASSPAGGETQTGRAGGVPHDDRLRDAAGCRGTVTPPRRRGPRGR